MFCGQMVYEASAGVIKYLIVFIFSQEVSTMSWSNDVVAVLRGVEKVRHALVTHQQKELIRLWKNSSLRTTAGNAGIKFEEQISSVLTKQRSAMVIDFLTFESRVLMHMERLCQICILQGEVGCIFP